MSRENLFLRSQDLMMDLNGSLKLAHRPLVHRAEKGRRAEMEKLKPVTLKAKGKERQKTVNPDQEVERPQEGEAKALSLLKKENPGGDERHFPKKSMTRECWPL